MSTEEQQPTAGPTGCTHDTFQVLSDDQAWEHFSDCLPEREAVAYFSELREAASRWWAHQEAANLRRVEVQIHGWHRDGQCPPLPAEEGEHPSIEVESKDMCVHVVLPGGAVVTLADEQRVDDMVMETFSLRDLGVMTSLLVSAQQEVQRAQTKYHYRDQESLYSTPPPVPRTVPAWGPFGGTL